MQSHESRQAPAWLIFDVRQNMDATRYKAWVDASRAFEDIEPMMLVILQGIGRLDCELIAEDSAYMREGPAKIESELRLTHRFTLSYLWVLGAYEFTRTLHQRSREPFSRVAALSVPIGDYKRSIERLRMPLAKLEAAKKFPADSPIAFPALHRELGIAWQLGRQTYVTRRELSDGLLTLVGRVRENRGLDASHP